MLGVSPGRFRGALLRGNLSPPKRPKGPALEVQGGRGRRVSVDFRVQMGLLGVSQGVMWTA